MYCVYGGTLVTSGRTMSAPCRCFPPSNPMFLGCRCPFWLVDPPAPFSFTRPDDVTRDPLCAFSFCLSPPAIFWSSECSGDNARGIWRALLSFSKCLVFFSFPPLAPWPFYPTALRVISLFFVSFFPHFFFFRVLAAGDYRCISFSLFVFFPHLA